MQKGNYLIASNIIFYLILANHKNKYFKLMKKILYAIIGISALYLILCFFGPSKIKVERSIDIKTSSVEDLQHRLADLKFFHDKWSPWTRRDPSMKTTYTGVCCEAGST